MINKLKVLSLDRVFDGWNWGKKKIFFTHRNYKSKCITKLSKEDTEITGSKESLIEENRFLIPRIIYYTQRNWEQLANESYAKELLENPSIQKLNDAQKMMCICIVNIFILAG